MALINQQLVQEALASPEFGEAMFAVAKHTIEEEKEAGFVVYSHGESSFMVSDIVHGTTTFDSIADIFEQSVDLGSLILNGEDLRSDLLITLHSHPDEGDDQAPIEALLDIETFKEYQARQGRFKDVHKRLLFPSDGDIALYGLINEINPSHVSTILTTDIEISLAGLLMYRHTDPNSPKPSPFDPESYKYSKNYMLPMMTKDGYTHIETDYDFNQKTFSQEADEIVSVLFP